MHMDGGWCSGEYMASSSRMRWDIHNSKTKHDLDLKFS